MDVSPHCLGLDQLDGRRVGHRALTAPRAGGTGKRRWGSVLWHPTTSRARPKYPETLLPRLGLLGGRCGYRFS
jgi:hypothetical protein